MIPKLAQSAVKLPLWNWAVVYTGTVVRGADCGILCFKPWKREEEEGLILEDGPTDRATILVLVER